ncbi:unnamed protein product [Coffea canephora]|uniref:Uncharacterized protein n=1 Tax=Coffea canephora TaxID=49390 RepID=A0A068U0D9_COFCA|nr:unnamed protein product [Coffea canephora]
MDTQIPISTPLIFAFSPQDMNLEIGLNNMQGSETCL